MGSERCEDRRPGPCGAAAPPKLGTFKRRSERSGGNYRMQARDGISEMGSEAEALRRVSLRRSGQDRSEALSEVWGASASISARRRRQRSIGKPVNSAMDQRTPEAEVTESRDLRTTAPIA